MPLLITKYSNDMSPVCMYRVESYENVLILEICVYAGAGTISATTVRTLLSNPRGF